MRIAPIALLVGSLVAAACDDSDINLIIPPPPFGTFILRTANGRALPAVIADSVNPPLRIEVLSGSITLNNNSTFSDITDFRQTLAGVITTNSVVCSGTFTVAGSLITFQEAVLPNGCGGTFTGVLTGNRLEASIRGVPAVYVR